MGSRITRNNDDILVQFPRELMGTIKKAVEHYIHTSNIANKRQIDSKFDITYVYNLVHYCTFLEMKKNHHNLSVIDQLHQGVTWRDVRLVREDIVKDFFWNSYLTELPKPEL